MIPKLFMARTTGVFDPLHRRPQKTGLVGLNLAGNHQLTGGGFKGASQFLKASLFLPDIVRGAGMVLLSHLWKVFPRFVGQRVEFHRAVSEFFPIEGNTATQHATQVFAGLEHLLENGLALAKWRIGVDAATSGQRQAGQQYNGKSFKSHGGFRSRETAASIPASSANTNSPNINTGCMSAWSTLAIGKGITP